MAESTSSKTEIMKPVILKAGIPLALSMAGLICAKIMARKRNTANAESSSQPQVNDSDVKSVTNFSDADDESVHSLSSTCLDYGEHIVTNPNWQFLDKSNPGEEILGLTSVLNELQERELKLEMHFLRYCELKEQETMLMEVRNNLRLDMARLELLDREISLTDAENQRVEKLVMDYTKALKELRERKYENGVLHRRVKKLSRKVKHQGHIIRKSKMEIEEKDAEVLSTRSELEQKLEDKGKIEEESVELRSMLDQLLQEKNELVIKLNLAEKAASSQKQSESEEESITIEEYNALMKELEQIQKERAAEENELIYLRWSNACLRHELAGRNLHIHQEQMDTEKPNSRTDLAALLDVGNEDRDLEHEMNENNSISGHPGSCLGMTKHDHVHSKRSNLLQKLKKWVEGNDKGKPLRGNEKEKHDLKCFVRNSSSSEAEDEHVDPARRSCSSA